MNIYLHFLYVFLFKLKDFHRFKVILQKIKMSAPKRIRLDGIKQFQYNQYTILPPPIDWNEYRRVNGINLEIPTEIANRRAALEEHEKDAC